MKSPDLLRRSKSVFIHTTFSNILNLVMNVVLARSLGPAFYGIYTVAIGISRLFSRISLLGMQDAIIRFVPLEDMENEEKYNLKRGVILSNTLLIAVPTLLIIGFALSYFSQELAVKVFNKEELKVALFWGGILLPVNGLIIYANSFLRAKEQFDLYTVLSLTLRSVLAFVAIGLVLAMTKKVGFVLFAYVFSGAIVILLIAHNLHRRSFFYGLHINFSFRIVKTILRFSMPSLFIAFSFSILSNIDKIMLAKFVSTREVGIYSAASRLVMQTGIIMASFNVAFMPRISPLYELGKTNLLNFEYRNITRWSLSMVLPVLLFFFFFAREAMLVFGKNYLIGTSIIQVMVLGILAKTIVGPTYRLLQMSGKQDLAFVNSILLIFLNVILNYFLIRSIGAIGAAIATSTSLFLINFLELIEVRILLKLWPFDTKFFKIFLALAIGVVFYFLVSLLVGRIVSLILVIVGWIVLFFFIPLTKEERKIIMSSIFRMEA